MNCKMIDRKSCNQKGVLYHYFAVLLAAFLFFLGITGTMAGCSQIEDISLSEMLSSPIQGVKDLYKIEGARNLKDMIQTDAGPFNGEVAPGQKIRAHFFLKVRPLQEINEKRKANGREPLTYFHWNCTVYVRAKNGDKVIAEYKQSHENAIDNTIEYQVPKEAKVISVGMKGQYSGQIKDKDKPFTGKLNSGPIDLFVNDKLEPVPLPPAKPYSPEEITTEITTDRKPDGDKPAGKADGKPAGKRSGGVLGSIGWAVRYLAGAALIGLCVRYLIGRRKEK